MEKGRDENDRGSGHGGVDVYHVRLKTMRYSLWEVPENTLFIKPSGLAGETQDQHQWYFSFSS